MTTQAKIFLAVLIVIATLLNACESAAKKQQRKDEEARRNQQLLTSSLAVTQQEAVNADEETAKIIDLLGENPVNAAMAKARAQSVRGSLGKVISGIRIADKQFAQTKKDYWAEKKRADTAEADSSKPFRNTLAGLIVVGLVAGAVGIALLFAVPGLLGKGIVAGGWTLALSAVALRASDFWIYVFCGGLCVIGLAWIAYKLFTRERKLKKQTTALADVGEAVKAVDKILPDAPVKALVVSRVDPATKQLTGLTSTGGTIDETDISPPPGDTPET